MAVTKSAILLAVVATYLLPAVAEQEIGAPVPPNLLTRLANFNTREDSRPRPRVSSSSTAVLIPIATVCPSAEGSGATRGPFQSVSLPMSVPGVGGGSIVSATAVMPDGSSTVFASRRETVDNALHFAAEATTLPDGVAALPIAGRAADMGNLVIGSNRCQTLYMPTRTAICSTVVTPAALPPVTITDCNQYVTFSSETIFTCSPAPSVTPLSSGANTDTIRNEVADMAELFTTRPFSANETFENSTTTYTPDTDFNNVQETSITTPTTTFGTSSTPSTLDADGDGLSIRDIVSVSAISGMPMSLPRQMQEHSNMPTKRQILVSKGKPIMTDLAVIAPGMLDKRHGNAPNVVPTSMGLSKAMPSINTSTATGIQLGTGRVIGTLLPANMSRSADPIAEAAGTAVTRMMPIPGVLRSKFERYRMVLKHRHALNAGGVQSHAEEPEEVTVRTSAFRKRTESSPFRNNSTSNSTYLNDTVLDAGLGTFTPIRLTDINHQANAAELSPPAPTKYYAAPWYEILRGGVPTHVKGITCYGGVEPLGDCLVPDTPGDGDLEKCECSTVDESWTITTQKLTRVGFTVASFNGPVLVTAGTLTTTTRISFTTTVQTTKTFTQASVKKITLSTPTIKPTITATLTKIPSATISLVSLPQITSIAETPNVRPAAAESPQDAPSSIAGDNVPTTVFETSIVATETVTVPPINTPGPNDSNDQDVGLENDVPQTS